MIQTIKSMFDVIDGSEWNKLAEFYTADCLYERPGYPPIHGFPALDHFYREERRIASGRHVVLAHFERLNGIAVTGSFAGKLHDGELVSLEFADCYEFADGLIKRRKTFFYAPLV